MYLMNRCGGVIDLFPKDPVSALALLESCSDYIYDEGERYRAVGPEEARKLFEAQGISVLDIYAVCGWMDLLRIPQKLQESNKWDKDFFNQAAKMVLRLSKEPSVKGVSRHLVLYGKRV